MRKKLEVIVNEKPIAYQLCAANLVYLLQHHACSSTGKVRVKVRLNKKNRNVKAGKGRRDDKREMMILRCDHDIQISSIKKLFGQKFHLPVSSLTLFSNDSIILEDKETIGDVVLRSGGFDTHSPVKLNVYLHEDEAEDSMPSIDDEMPILEIESYEVDSPPPTLPVLEPELSTSSTSLMTPSSNSSKASSTREIFDARVELHGREQNESEASTSGEPSTPTFEQKPALKRMSTFEDCRPPKTKKTNSGSNIVRTQDQSPSTTQKDLMAFFNFMNPAFHQTSTTSTQSPTSNIFESPTARSNRSEMVSKTFPALSPDLSMILQLQMLANNPTAAMNSLPTTPSQMPNLLSPFQVPLQSQSKNNTTQLSVLQDSMNDTVKSCNLLARMLQMSTQFPMKMNVKKPGATVKPMRRESTNKESPATPTDARKNGSIEDFKEETNASDSTSLQQLLTCAKI